MDMIKTTLMSVAGLVVLLIVTHIVINLGKKAPVIGGAVEKVEDLAFQN
jgi:hypothetical protein